MSYKSTFATFAVLSAVPLNAAVITLSSGDSLNNSSYNTAGNWSNGLAPSSGNTYEVGVSFLRSPVAGGNFTFGGDSLKLNAGGALLSKNGGAQTLTSNLILNGGYVRSGSGVPDPLTLAGSIAVTSVGGGLVPDQSPFTVTAVVSGTSGTLTLASDAAVVGGGASGPGRGITFTGASTFTGNVNVRTVGVGTTFSPTSSWNFLIGANGINNSISGTGIAAFNGAFVFNLTGAGTTVGNSWDIATVTTKSFDTTFSVSGFTDNGNDTWSSGNYLFSESTGVLQVVPEPSVALLGGLGLLGMLRRRRH